MIKIKGKKCKIRFGGSALIRLGRLLKTKTLEDTLDKVSKLDFEDVTLDSVEMLSKIILAGLQNADGNVNRISENDIQDLIFTGTDEITRALELFVESISVDSEGEEVKETKKK